MSHSHRTAGRLGGGILGDYSLSIIIVHGVGWDLLWRRLTQETIPLPSPPSVAPRNLWHSINGSHPVLPWLALVYFSHWPAVLRWPRKPGCSSRVFSLSCRCCCSSATSCPTLHDPVDFSSPAFPVPHHLPELAQVHVHCISDAIPPSHPRSLSSHLSCLYNFLLVISSTPLGLITWTCRLLSNF